MRNANNYKSNSKLLMKNMKQLSSLLWYKFCYLESNIAKKIDSEIRTRKRAIDNQNKWDEIQACQQARISSHASSNYTSKKITIN